MSAFGILFYPDGSITVTVVPSSAFERTVIFPPWAFVTSKA
ncbi:MAG: hypothetical protein ACYC9O_15470 [Candidatus Latescibacterota bacterium]